MERISLNLINKWVSWQSTTLLQFLVLSVCLAVLMSFLNELLLNPNWLTLSVSFSLFKIFFQTLYYVVGVRTMLLDLSTSLSQLRHFTICLSIKGSLS